MESRLRATRAGPSWAGGRAFGGRPSEKPYSVPKFYHAFDDSAPPDERYFCELARVAKRRIIWGGNYMGLGPASCWIVWDKKRRNMSQADCELAWTNLPGQSRIFEWRWNGMLQQDMRHKEKRIHPTQKPVALYAWLLEKFARPGYKILDTHVGSASSLIACRRAGLDYWGFEIDPVYYEAATKRLEAETAQCALCAEDLSGVRGKPV